MKTKIIQFSSARGPNECTFVVFHVLQLFVKQLVQNDLSYKVLYEKEGRYPNTLRSIVLQISGHDLSILNKWTGIIQWIGQSPYRKHHKRKNWFIGCFELEEEVSNIDLNPADIRFQSIRSSGPGGQHVNKVSSAIRATHEISGVSVLVMDNRSQHQNRKIALERIREKLMIQYFEAINEQKSKKWENHLNLERGNPVIILKGEKFKILK